MAQKITKLGKKAPAPPRRNMRAADREQFILEQAVYFFAERGFEGQTRELAKRMGVTHATIYRYFPSKEALIERVYEHVYLSRWDTGWGPLIRNRDLPLAKRLTRFYLEYVDRVFDYNWVRIFVSSGLKSFDITNRYLAIVRREIIEPACRELRYDLRLPDADRLPLSEREIEMFWGLHGRIFYMAIRRFVYCTPTPAVLDDIVRDAVESFITGSKKLMPKLAGEMAAKQSTKKLKQAGR